jgi:hypothetical protein
MKTENLTTKEKANELVDKFRLNVVDYEGNGLNDYKGKQCALISVDEIMKAPFENSYLELVPDDAPDSDWYWDKFRAYWEEVKNEINNL